VPVNSVSIIARFGLAAAVGLTVASAAFTQATPGGGQKAPAAPPAGMADPAAVKEKGRDLFATWGCASCHSLADADATGHVGPSFDGDANLTKAFVIDRVTNGQGPMPAFGGQMTDQEIAAIATYITMVATKN
jgi:mono/diheme cytochrome c family protein